MRTRVVGVRLEPNEHAAWSAALAASPWRSLAHWCREVVNDLLIRSSTAPTTSPELAEISAEDISRCVHLCAQLNAQAKDSSRLGRVMADSLSTARAVAELTKTLLPAVVERNPSPVVARDLRTRLVNVRLTDDEFEAWTNATARAGYARVSTWVRHSVASLVGYTIAPVLLTVPAGVGEVRKNLAGAAAHVAQLCDVAENYDAGLSDQFAQIRTQIVDLLHRYRALERRA